MSSSKSSTANPLQIPELLELILSHNTPPDLLSIQSTCSSFQHLIQTSPRILDPRSPQCFWLDTCVIHRTHLSKRHLKLRGITPIIPPSGFAEKDTGFPRRLKLSFRLSSSVPPGSKGRVNPLWCRIRLASSLDVQVRVQLFSDSGGGMSGLKSKSTVLKAGATVGEMLEWLVGATREMQTEVKGAN